jgi:hypothetical protein
MRHLPITVALSIAVSLPGPTVLASGDPPPAKSFPPVDKSSESKKEGDNGLGDLISGLAGQSLKVFMDPDLLKQIPGDNAVEKTENVRLLLGMIEGETLQDKFEVIRALQKLQSDPVLPKPTDEIKKRVKDWYPILEQFAGSDGYINRADVDPIIENIFDGTLRQMLAKTLPRLAARREARGRKPILADQDPLIREASKAKLQQFLDNVGVPEETKDADAQPAKREIWTKVFDQITEGGAVSIPKSLDFLKGLSTLPPPPVLRDKITFKNGLLVKKIEPFLLDGKVPKDLRISLEKKTGKLVIR